MTARSIPAGQPTFSSAMQTAGSGFGGFAGACLGRLSAMVGRVFSVGRDVIGSFLSEE